MQVAIHLDSVLYYNYNCVALDGQNTYVLPKASGVIYVCTCPTCIIQGRVYSSEMGR